VRIGQDGAGHRSISYPSRYPWNPGEPGDQIDAFSHVHRSGIGAQKATSAGGPFKQGSHGQGDGFGLIASGQAVRGGLDEGDNIGAVDLTTVAN